MQKITIKDLEFQVARYVRIMESEGINREIDLQPGSKTYGRAYRLYFYEDGLGGQAAYGTTNGYLGMTKAEALDTLNHICNAMEALQHIQEGN